MTVGHRDSGDFVLSGKLQHQIVGSKIENK
jgi:hypothetical protein